MICWNQPWCTELSRLRRIQRSTVGTYGEIQEEMSGQKTTCNGKLSFTSFKNLLARFPFKVFYHTFPQPTCDT
jgi:hypothetical protein